MQALNNPYLEEAEFRICERSVLYNLAPKYVGTRRQESLLSYLVRLARAHSLSPRDLIKHVLAAQDGQIKDLVYNSFYAEYSGPINGLGPYAGLFARILNALTSRGDLQILTMLPWEGIIPAQSEGFLARCPRWCPFCYGDQLQKDRETHTPLLWSLAPYKRCVVHGCRLEERCPECDKAQPFIPRIAEASVCSNCGASLARRSVEADAEHRHPVAPDSESPSSESLLAAMMDRHASIASIVGHELLCRSLKKILDDVYLGTRARLCQALGWNAWALNGWLNKGQKVSLPKLLQLSQCLGIDVVDLCSGNVDPGSLPSATLNHAVVRVVSRAPRPQLTAQQRREYGAAMDPVGQVKFPHLWPGQIPPGRTVRIVVHVPAVGLVSPA